ncbi:hypothetical protein MHU86_8102 [Fragilaria crotonensis]|nr:hypothetical protein MHU86_8102 [Fragilaria crotonensis]
MFAPTTLLRGYTCAQVFTDGYGYGYDKFYPLKSKVDASLGLLGFIQESGVLGWLISDGALEQRTRHWQDVVRDYQIRQTLTEPTARGRKRRRIRFALANVGFDGSCNLEDCQRGLGAFAANGMLGRGD